MDDSAVVSATQVQDSTSDSDLAIATSSRDLATGPASTSWISQLLDGVTNRASQIRRAGLIAGGLAMGAAGCGASGTAKDQPVGAPTAGVTTTLVIDTTTTATTAAPTTTEAPTTTLAPTTTEAPTTTTTTIDAAAIKAKHAEIQTNAENALINWGDTWYSMLSLQNRDGSSATFAPDDQGKIDKALTATANTVAIGDVVTEMVGTALRGPINPQRLALIFKGGVITFENGGLARNISLPKISTYAGTPLTPFAMCSMTASGGRLSMSIGGIDLASGKVNRMPGTDASMVTVPVDAKGHRIVDAEGAEAAPVPGLDLGIGTATCDSEGRATVTWDCEKIDGLVAANKLDPKDKAEAC